MSKQNIVIAGVEYSGVEKVSFTTAEGGKAAFVETSDATAAANEILHGRKAYINGEKVTGKLNIDSAAVGISSSKNYADMVNNGTFEGKIIDLMPLNVVDNTGEYTALVIHPDQELGTASQSCVLLDNSFTNNEGVNLDGLLAPFVTLDYDNPMSENTDILPVTAHKWEDIYVLKPEMPIGDATAADVLKGKTFTTMYGVGLEGEYEPLDTSDANAVAREICMDKTAYVNGEKITGTGLVYNHKETTTEFPNINLFNFDSTNGATYAICIGWITLTSTSGSIKTARFAFYSTTNTLENTTNSVNFGSNNNLFRFWVSNPETGVYRNYIDITEMIGSGTPKKATIDYYYRMF